MKFLDKHLKNVSISIMAFLIFYFAFKFLGIIIDNGFWLISLLMLLIYFELWDKK